MYTLYYYLYVLYLLLGKKIKLKIRSKKSFRKYYLNIFIFISEVYFAFIKNNNIFKIKGKKLIYIYIYKKNEKKNFFKTNSIFIPFYWFNCK